MRVAAGLLALAVCAPALARPSPKISRVKGPQRWNGKRDSYTPTNETDTSASSPTVTAPKTNVFNSLSNDEAAAVIGFLHNQTDLNLTAAADAGDWDNSILFLDLLPPNKTDALAYLDGNGTEPERWARVSMLFGATEEPYAQDWVVGPIGSNMSYWPDTFNTHTEDAKIRVYDMDDSTDFFQDLTMQMADIISDLLNATITNTSDVEATFDIWGIDPLWHETGDDGEDRVIKWVGYWRYPDPADDGAVTFDGETLLPQGLYLKTDITGRDQSKWSLVGILYADEYYTSIDDFRTAYSSEGFVKLVPNYSGDWIGTDQTGEALPLETNAPPMSVQPSGQRFKVDADQKYVEWMDFSFYLTFTRDTGMRLYDIKYKGDRIIYELGLQEAVAHYAGNDPVQSVPGFDVPLYSTCLNATFHASELSKSHRCGIAVFESDQGYLMQRHSSQNYISATKNVALTLRSVSTVGNYDYTFDYVFYLDGSVETIVRASGYIQSAYYSNNTEYGYQIHDSLSGSMHDHSLNWRVDFDILGTENTLVKHVVEAKDIQYKWNPTSRSTMHIVKKTVETEDEGKMNWSANGQEQVLVLNKDKLNKYGEERGYKMMPSRGGAGMHLTITNSSNLLNSQGFATHAYYVTKYKDNEMRGAHALNDYDTKRPLVNFDKFFDSESLVQEDLVMWFNLGMHHVPHTGDLPNTVMTTAQGGMMITPHNYLLGDPSRVSTQQIRIDYTNDNVTGVTTFGSEAATGTIDLDAIAWDAYTYSGDVAVRKFPYDPQNPFNDTESIV